jgi:undecaprenyl-diphosphatase
LAIAVLLAAFGWAQEAARDITSLGSIIVVVITTAAVAGYLFLTHKPGVAWLMLLAVAGGIVLNNLLKLVFARQEIWVEPGTQRINVSTDGEVSLMAAPLHYRIRPGALAVVVPHLKRS